MYVLWNGKAQVRPTYIGEGNVLRRFVEHMNKPWASRPIDGVVAFIYGETEVKKKAYAEPVESVFLADAERINRYPTQNRASGKARSALIRTLHRQDHNVKTIRIVISGRDPFITPEKPSMLDSKLIVLRDHGGGWYIAETCWNVRG